MNMLVQLILVFLITISRSTSSVWRDLTEEELKNWYSPTELCMLKSDDRVSYPQVVQSENCSEYSHGKLYHILPKNYSHGEESNLNMKQNREIT